MDDYSALSSVGWLDFDTAASERVSALLRSLEEPGTLDVLGLGAVRDAFSDMLAPGTSTIQTRLRYFMFIPWIFQRLEAEQVPPADFARRLKRAEAQLIERLRHLGAGNGVIGYYAGRYLNIMPSSIYWGGLGSWGIRKLERSIDEYGRTAAISRHQLERNDDGDAIGQAAPLWMDMPSPPPGFLDRDIDFELRSEEARVLIEGIQRHHPKSLLAHLSRRPEAASGVKYPWDLPTDGLPDDLRSVLRHARCFSELTLGPRLVYNVLLARRAGQELGQDRDRHEEDQRKRLDKWTAMVTEQLDELRCWVNDPLDFWRTLRGYDVSATTKTFVEAVVNQAVQNPEAFADDPEVHKLIRDRELRLKSNRARLVHRSALENWQGPPATAQLDYRWRITRSYLDDLAAAAGAAAGRASPASIHQDHASAAAPAGTAG